MFSRLLLEKKKQDELLDQIDALKQKVANANEGLAAANRLSEQLEKKTQTIAMLKHEIKLREDLLKKAQNELKDANSSNTVKVDRYLVKNLVVGYVNADQAKKREVLKIIGIHDFIFYNYINTIGICFSLRGKLKIEPILKSVYLNGGAIKLLLVLLKLRRWRKLLELLLLTL